MERIPYIPCSSQPRFSRYAAICFRLKIGVKRCFEGREGLAPGASFTPIVVP